MHTGLCPIQSTQYLPLILWISTCVNSGRRDLLQPCSIDLLPICCFIIWGQSPSSVNIGCANQPKTTGQRFIICILFCLSVLLSSLPSPFCSLYVTFSNQFLYFQNVYNVFFIYLLSYYPQHFNIICLSYYYLSLYSLGLESRVE